MFFASVIIGYFTMPIILGTQSRNLRYHRNKVYGALLMGAWMALVEVLMAGYSWKTAYYSVFWILLIGVFTYMILHQTGINEREFLEGMIEHHAMGIAMAEKVLERKDITEETQGLADRIVRTQTTEIDQMDKLLKPF